MIEGEIKNKWKTSFGVSDVQAWSRSVGSKLGEMQKLKSRKIFEDQYPRDGPQLTAEASWHVATGSGYPYANILNKTN